MITITCTEAEKIALMNRMNLTENDPLWPLDDNFGNINWMAHINWIIGTKAQTEKVLNVLHKHYPWGEV